MRGHHLEGVWRELRGRIRERWGEMTHDDGNVIAGQRDQLIGKVQQLYGTAAEQAERKITAFERWTGHTTRGH